MNNRIKKYLIIIIGLLLICAFLFGIIWFQERTSGSLEITFFDVGQGDSIIIQTPSNHTILIDGGPDSSVLSKLGRAMPFYDHTIDLMVFTHAHSDHVAGLVEVVKRYEIEKVLYTGVPHTSPDFIAWQDLIEEKGIAMVVAQAGQEFLFDQVEFEVLYPFEDVSGQKFEDLNDSSIVMRMDYQDTSYLFTGDAPVEVEEELLGYYNLLGSSDPSYPLECDVLKVGHHGSKYSSSLEFVQTVGPEYAVIQVGEGNRFGHPHKMIIKRLEGLGIEVFRNDEMGDIKMVSDGEGVWVEQ